MSRHSSRKRREFKEKNKGEEENHPTPYSKDLSFCGKGGNPCPTAIAQPSALLLFSLGEGKGGGVQSSG